MLALEKTLVIGYVCQTRITKKQFLLVMSADLASGRTIVFGNIYQAMLSKMKKKLWVQTHRDNLLIPSVEGKSKNHIEKVFKPSRFRSFSLSLQIVYS